MLKFIKKVFNPNPADKCVINGTFSKELLAYDIYKRRLRGEDMIRKVWKDPRIKAAKTSPVYNKKIPRKDWTPAYAGELQFVPVFGDFSLDILCYLDKVCEYVHNRHPEFYQ